jgi:hypothetical protein
MNLGHKGLFARIMADKNATVSHIKCFHLIASNIHEDNACYLTNENISEILGIKKSTASNLVSWLEKNNYIGRKIYYKKNSKEIAYRATFLVSDPIHSVSGYPIHSVSGSKPPKGVVRESKEQTAFKKPSKEDITLYCEEVGYPLNEIDSFLNFYESKGWKVGKNTMVNWKASYAGWMTRKGIKQTKSKTNIKELRQLFLNKRFIMNEKDYTVTLDGIFPTYERSGTSMNLNEEETVYERLSKHS